VAFPVLPVVLPSSLSGAVNGRLSAGVLEVLGCPGRKGARAHPLAAAAFRSLSAAVLGVSGEVLTVTSNADAYRSYEVQELTFRARYTLEVMLRPSKIWDGRRWFQRPGVAMSAVPGTSNHGWGLAFDVCGWSGDETVYIESLKAWPWIRANAGRFGLSWEAQSEPWHLRYVAGDRVPDAVDQPEVPGGPAGVDAGVPAPTLRLGSSGSEAFELIGVLKFWGWYPKQWMADRNDGKIGARAVEGIKEMQTALGRRADGVYGPVTAQALRSFFVWLESLGA